MNRKQQGDVGVAVAIAYYTKRGYAVSVPLSDAMRYDLVVDDGAQILRVQVKTTGRQRAGKYVAQLRTCGGNRSWSGVSKTISAGECDLVFVYTMNGDCYEFPTSRLDGMGTLVLGSMVQQFRAV